MSEAKVIGVIPARYNSTRFPGKPLVDILGKTMIQRVYEQAQKAKTIQHVIVATDDQRIFDEVQRFGGDVRMTPRHLQNGTERVAWVAADLNYSIIANIQGDEPFIDPVSIDVAVSLLLDDDRAVMSTLAKPVSSEEELHNPNLPKVIMDQQQYAIYFTRAVIPHIRDATSQSEWLNLHRYFRHIGMYVYRQSFLTAYVKLKATPLEQAEKLEQLRALEHGYKIKIGVVPRAPQGIDTPEDLQTLLDKLRKGTIGNESKR